MTITEFLAWEERQELRWEFDGFQAVAMTGGTLAHEIIGGNIRATLHNRLVVQRCRLVGPTMKIEVNGRIRYPDAFVFCTPVAPRDTVVREPVVVFEVLSESTSRTDRIEKLREYGATPSVQRYVLLEQDAIAAMVFVRRGPHLVVETLTTAILWTCRRSACRCPWRPSTSGSSSPRRPPLRRSSNARAGIYAGMT